MKNPFKQHIPSALEMAVAELQDAQRHRLVSTANREYAESQERMYIGREDRLRRDVARLLSETEKQETLQEKFPLF